MDHSSTVVTVQFYLGINKDHENKARRALCLRSSEESCPHALSDSWHYLDGHRCRESGAVELVGHAAALVTGGSDVR